ITRLPADEPAAQTSVPSQPPDVSSPASGSPKALELQPSALPPEAVVPQSVRPDKGSVVDPLAELRGALGSESSDKPARAKVGAASPPARPAMPSPFQLPPEPRKELPTNPY
ncbi:MAG TPA: hypothetical protein VI299_27155, partial [Polyangiales bacterium]